MTPVLRLALISVFICALVLIPVILRHLFPPLVTMAPERPRNVNLLEDWMLSLLSMTRLTVPGLTGSQFRLFRSLHQAREGRPLTSLEEQVYQRMEVFLFNWLPVGMKMNDIRRGSLKGRGVIIALGDNYLNMGVHLIKCIHMLGSRLPIHVYYAGAKDLKEEHRAYLSKLANVTLVDITSTIRNDILKLGGWDVKPFAMLLNPFEEVILLDADVVLLEPPEHFFELATYKQSGALFFRDRHFAGAPGGKYADWLQSILPSPLSEKVMASAMYQGQSKYEQESGIVIINKGRRFWGLLATCLLNRIEERDVIHSMTHGEKETFWLGFEMAREQYTWAEAQAGLIHSAELGKPEEEKVLCGHIAHFDDKGNLLWFNDGIVVDKRSKKLDPEHFRIMSSEGVWGYCLRTNKTRAIPPPQMEILNKTVKLWAIDPLKPDPSSTSS